MRMRRPAHRTGQQQRATRAGIEVPLIQIELIERREPVDYGKPGGGGKLDEALAEVLAAGVGVERAIAGVEVDIVFRVDGGNGSTCPEGALAAVGRVVVNRHLP